MCMNFAATFDVELTALLRSSERARKNFKQQQEITIGC